MTLRVFIDHDLGSGHACPWVMVGRDGRVLREGASVRGAWPSADRTELVLPAAHARLIAIRLPTMPRERLDRAAAYAVEEQLATPIDASAIVALPGADGSTLVAVAHAELVSQIANAAPPNARLVPEAALAPTGRGWRWYVSGAGDSFLRRSDGSSFASTAPGDHDTLPSELATALALARRHDDVPERIEVAFDAPSATLVRWQQASGVPFVLVPRWRWQDAGQSDWERAPDLLVRRDRDPLERRRGSNLAAFRLPLLLAAVALGLHAAALAIQWTVLEIKDWQSARALETLARQAGVATAGDANAVAAALADRHRTILHRAGKPAPADALPLLARAAAPLATLPRAAVTSANYADGAWTLSIAGIEGAQLDSLVGRLRDAGIDTLAVPVASGSRVRLALDPAAQ